MRSRTMKKTVSIIIPTYNDEEYLSHCLSTCVSQTYGQIEVFVIDDGSKSDATKDIVFSFLQRDSRIRYFQQENAGPGVARNYGLSLVSDLQDKYVCFIDSDDWVELDYIQRLVEALEENDCDMVCGRSPLTDGSILSGAQAIAALCEWKLSMGVCDKIIKGSALPQNPFGTWSRFGEDTVAFFRCYLEEGVRVFATAQEYGYHYEQRTDSATAVALTPQKALEYLFLWVNIAREFLDSSVRDKTAERMVFWRLGSEILQMDPLVSQIKTPSQDERHKIDAVFAFLKTEKALLRFKPKTAQEFFKKWLRIVCPHLYCRLGGK